MNSSKQQSELTAWSKMWRQPCVTTFAGMFPNSYDDTIRDFWEQQLVDHVDHVVDIACGNGALTWLCNEFLNAGETKTRITGMDAATIDPFTALEKDPAEYPEIHFIGDTPAEKLPLEDGSVDIVVSQYGIEYSDLDMTVPEVARVLRDTAKICLIVHDEHSVIVRESVRFLDDHHEMLESEKFHELALELVQLIEQHGTGTALKSAPAYTDLQSRIAAAVSRFDDRAKMHPRTSGYAQYIIELNRATNENVEIPAEVRRARVLAARDALAIATLRLDELAEAALSEQDRQDLKKSLESYDFTVTRMQTIGYKSEENFGTTLVAERNWQRSR